ncbi:MAG: hypothetical protein J0M36_12590 [Caulobacterales bacterium]|nr:hypothetical protein [Caulobacterales bacterium]
MTKNILLAATAASVMAFAGAASAHTLTFQTGPVAGIDATETGGPTSAYKLASEAKVPPGSANFALVDTLSGGNLPSGNVILTVNLTGATFASAVGAGVVTGAAGCTTFTSTLSSGGASGSTTVSFVISNSAPDCSALNLLLPITPGAGTATVTTTLATEAGTPIDGLTASRNIVTRGSAFDVVFDAGIGAGALADTFATLAVTPVYTTFSTTGGHTGGAPESATVGQLGTIRITVDTTQHADLGGVVFATAAHVTDADTVVSGNFTAFDGAGGGATLAAAATMTASTATINNQQAALTAGAVPFIVTRETGGVIPSSTYSATVTYTLDGTFYNQESPATGALETIQRDGTNVIFPWMNSTSIQTVTGTTNLIRLGNTGSASTGPVFAQVLNAASSASGYTAAPAPVQIAASIAGNSELVINTATLSSALGNWGRGDVQISIEAPSNTITARRYATLSNGSITEFQSGTVASDQNQLNVP